MAISSNEKTYQELGFQVAREILGVADMNSVHIGPLSKNYFSFTFPLSISSQELHFFVKIPKDNMRGSDIEILPINHKDRILGDEEAASLRFLNQNWKVDHFNVRWVNLRGTIPAYNALITDRIFAPDIIHQFRRMDLRRRFGFIKDGKQLQDLMGRIGASLGRFHQLHSTSRLFSLSDSVSKYEFYCHELAKNSKSAWPERILKKILSISNFKAQTFEVPTFKGIDIRNVLLDTEKTIYFLDPGKTKVTFYEADLARFLMTYRILYWGNKRLLFLNEPDRKAENAFLKAYFQQMGVLSSPVYNLFLLKEQLKHWYVALDSLNYLSWPAAIKSLATRIYVKSFYEKQVSESYALLPQ
ncbi:hypothetical protein K1X76_03525 [bacterium]|nr:hypothetical protein [bacterium]